MGVQLLFIAMAVAASMSPGVEGAQIRANPIRKVVNLLQAIQKKVLAEGKKELELYNKFECYCSNSGGDLKKGIAAAEEKIPQLETVVAEAGAKKAQLEEDLKQHRADRDAAKTAMKEATAIREKEAAAFAAMKAESDANTNALNQAIAALSKGMAGGFLQTGAATVLRNLVSAKHDVLGDYRQEVLSFLAGDSAYAPQSGEVVGIMKQILDSMIEGLSKATAAEEAALKAYSELMAAKKKEVAALTASIEEKLERSGNVAVEAVQAANDLEDTKEALAEDQNFLAELEKSCGTKAEEWEARKKTRTEELLAIAETITILNNDDALELFKKTLPSPSESFVQVRASATAMRSRALSIVRAVRRPELDFIALAIQGKSTGFEKIIEMIDAMVETLKKEQLGDDDKKNYCAAEFDSTDDKKKSLESAIAAHNNEIAELDTAIADVKAEIKALQEGIAALDKSVEQAKANRKAEHEDYTELMASDAAAVEVLNFAKNRLNKFYQPALYKPPPKKKLAEDDQIVANLGGTVVLQQKDAPPPPPETFGDYKKQTEATTGVVAMVDLLIKDLDKEMTEAETTEKHAQKDYEETMASAAAKRAEDSNSITQKSAAQAELESSLGAEKEEKSAAGKELGATLEAIAALHADCDWLVKYFDARKAARAGEVDSLRNAKAVLSGADYE